MDGIVYEKNGKIVMKIMKFLAPILLAISFVGCSTSIGGSSSGSSVEKEKFEVALVGGGAVWETYSTAESYRVSANSSVIGETDGTSFSVVDAIIEEVFSPWGEWQIRVDALNAEQTVVATSSQKMRIRDLNEGNFQTILSGEYSSSDYFMLTEDIYYFGSDDVNLKLQTPSGYAFAEMLYKSGVGGVKCFINQPLSATLDGNGYTINLLVDRPLLYRSDTVMGAGALFVSMTETGVLKNIVLNADYTYVQYGAQFTASAVYQDCAGRIENCWFNSVLRPIKNDPDIVTHEYSFGYEYDDRAAIIGSTASGFTCKNSVFALQVLDENGNEVLSSSSGKLGGAVCLSKEGSNYENCVFIQKGGEARFVNDTWSFASAAMGSSLAENVYYYPTIAEFIGGSGGFGYAGDFKEKLFFTQKEGVVYGSWPEVWDISESEVLIKGAIAYES